MKAGATYTKRAVLARVLFLGVVGVLTYSSALWASTRFGDDIEVQAWYRDRNTFQYDKHGHFDWVQWRNEAFVWLMVRDLENEIAIAVHDDYGRLIDDGQRQEQTANRGLLFERRRSQVTP